MSYSLIRRGLASGRVKINVSRLPVMFLVPTFGFEQNLRRKTSFRICICCSHSLRPEALKMFWRQLLMKCCIMFVVGDFWKEFLLMWIQMMSSCVQWKFRNPFIRYRRLLPWHIIGWHATRRTSSDQLSWQLRQRRAASAATVPPTASAAAPVEKELPREAKETLFVVQREEREKNWKQRKGKTQNARTQRGFSGNSTMQCDGDASVVNASKIVVNCSTHVNTFYPAVGYVQWRLF